MQLANNKASGRVEVKEYYVPTINEPSEEGWSTDRNRLTKRNLSTLGLDDDWGVAAMKPIETGSKDEAIG